MAFWKRKDEPQQRETGGAPGPAAVVVVSLAGRADLLPDFSHPLAPGGTVCIGRDEACDIQIVDRQVSRRHLSIRHDPEQDSYHASDLGSANGTFVNTHKLNREVHLREGDVIDIGDSRLVFTRERFADHESALRHFRSKGERGRGTLIN